MDAPDENVLTIENVSPEDVRPGDYIVWETRHTGSGSTLTMRREGVAHHRGVSGEWRTDVGGLLTEDMYENATLTIHRIVKELPTERGAVIVPADGYEAIDATWDGFGWLASEAVLDADGKWHGVWRRELGRGVIGSVGPECITTRTCKVSDQ